MKNEQDTPTKKQSAAYDSNPFSVAWTGVQKLIKTNSQTVVGVALFNILLTALLVVTVGLIFLAVLTFVIKHDDALSARYALPTNSGLGFLSNMSDGSIYVTWILGFAMCVFLVALMQSLQLNLSVAAAKEVTLKFGALLKQSVKSIPPILGFIGLVALTLTVGSIVIGLLSIVLGYITFLIGMIALLAAVYASLRLSFTVFIIVDQHVGPVAAMRQSWKTTNGHLIETIGSAFTSALILTVPDIIMTALSRVTESMPLLSALFGILSAIITTVLVIGATMAMAERYTQINALNEHKLSSVPLSPFNYAAILLAIFMISILNALSPKMNNDQFNDPYYNNTFKTLPADGANNSYPTQLN